MIKTLNKAHQTFDFITQFILVGLLVFSFNSIVYAQTCTINSGVPLNDCANNVFLDGFASPSALDLSTVSWSVISQPAGANVVIDDVTSLVSSLSGTILTGSYTFQIQGDCSDMSGTTTDQVTHVINMAPDLPNNGEYNAGCYTGGGIVYDYSPSYTLEPNETISWSYSGGATGTLLNENTLTPTFFPDPLFDYCIQDNYFETYFSVIVTNTLTGCSDNNTQLLEYDFAEDPVEVKPYPIEVCGLCTVIEGTCRGNDGGLWTYTGPGNATFTNETDSETGVCVDIEGTYTFTWTVSGSCINGSDDITIKFNDFGGGAIWPYAGDDIRVCDFPNTLALNGSPLENGLTGVWTQTGGLPATIDNPNDPNSTVSGLVAGSNYYAFVWTVCGPNCCVADEVELFEIYKPTFSEKAISCVTSNSFDHDFANTEYFPQLSIDTFWLNLNVVALPEEADANGFHFSIQETARSLAGGTGGSILGATVDPLHQGDSYSFNFDEDDLDKYSGSPNYGPNPPISLVLRLDERYAITPAPGYYEFDITYSTGCDIKTATYKIHIASMASQEPNAGTDAILPCGVDNVLLSGSNNLDRFGVYFGEWSMVSGPGPDPFSTLGINRRQQAPNLTGLLEGVYVFKLINTSSFLDVCNNYRIEDIMKVTVSNVAPLPVSTSLNQIEVCSGGLANISGTLPSNAGIGVWTQTIGPLATIESPNGTNTNISGLAASTAYEFTWTVTNGCGSNFDAISFTTSSNESPSQAEITRENQCGINNLSGSSTTLVTGIAPAVGTVTWDIIDHLNQPQAILTGPTDSYVGLTDANSSLGGYIVITMTVTNSPCTTTSVDTVVYTLQPTYSDPGVIIDAGEDIFRCSETSLPITLTLNGTESGFDAFQKWEYLSGPAIPTFSDYTSLTPDVTFSENGIYKLKLSSFWHEECLIDEDILTVTISNPGPPAFAGPDQNECGGTGVFTLDALDLGSGEIGKWSVESTTGAEVIFADDSDPNTTATLSGLGIVRLKWSTFNELSVCPSNQDVMEIVFINSPIVQTDKTYCDAANITISGENLTAISGYTTTWTHSGPGIPVIDTPNSFSSLISNLAVGVHTFTYEITDGICTQSSDVVITIDEFILADAGPDQTFCGGETITLSGNLPSSGTVEWKLYSGVDIGTFTDETTNLATYGPLVAEESIQLFYYQWFLCEYRLCSNLYSGKQYSILYINRRNLCVKFRVNRFKC